MTRLTNVSLGVFAGLAVCAGVVMVGATVVHTCEFAPDALRALQKVPITPFRDSMFKVQLVSGAVFVLSLCLISIVYWIADRRRGWRAWERRSEGNDKIASS